MRALRQGLWGDKARHRERERESSESRTVPYSTPGNGGWSTEVPWDIGHGGQGSPTSIVRRDGPARATQPCEAAPVLAARTPKAIYQIILRTLLTLTRCVSSAVLADLGSVVANGRPGKSETQLLQKGAQWMWDRNFSKTQELFKFRAFFWAFFLRRSPSLR